MDCTSKEFCLKASCGANVMGACMAGAPTRTILDPVCGCDGVTYWNGSYLSSTSKAAQSKGPCNGSNVPKAKGCTIGTCGGSSQYCVFARNGCASASATGTCWALPDKCDNTVAAEITCEGLQDGPCANVCDLIMNNKPFHVVSPACVP